jgi:FkbM family methyltransferase
MNYFNRIKKRINKLITKICGDIMQFLKNPLNFIKKANKSFNLFLEHYDKIFRFLNDYDKNQEKIDRFLGDYNVIRTDLMKAIDTFNTNYAECKNYFFNGDEHLFKMRNTDDFFKMCFFNNIQLLSYSPSENKIYLKTEDGIVLVTNNRYATIKEIFARNGYSVPVLYQFKDFVVFDVGMNRGYSALKFANFDSCKAVYGFEIDKDTYNFALENFNLNLRISHKIKPYNFGLSDEEDEVDIYSLPGCDGITTTRLEFTDIQGEWKNGKQEMKIKKAKVKSAGSFLSNIIQNESINSKIVLKIDTEGAEDKIIDDLIREGVLNKVDLIMGEIHLDTFDLDNKLTGFKEINKVYHTEDIYSFCYVREELYNELPLSKFS